jgi:hypothetical protein
MSQSMVIPHLDSFSATKTPRHEGKTIKRSSSCFAPYQRFALYKHISFKGKKSTPTQHFQF